LPLQTKLERRLEVGFSLSVTCSGSSILSEQQYPDEQHCHARAFQTMLLLSQDTPPSIDEAKPEAQATPQTNLGTGMRAFYVC